MRAKPFILLEEPCITQEDGLSLATKAMMKVSGHQSLVIFFITHYISTLFLVSFMSALKDAGMSEEQFTDWFVLTFPSTSQGATYSLLIKRIRKLVWRTSKEDAKKNAEAIRQMITSE